MLYVCDAYINPNIFRHYLCSEWQFVRFVYMEMGASDHFSQIFPIISSSMATRGWTKKGNESLNTWRLWLFSQLQPKMDWTLSGPLHGLETGWDLLHYFTTDYLFRNTRSVFVRNKQTHRNRKVALLKEHCVIKGNPHPHQLKQTHTFRNCI